MRKPIKFRSDLIYGLLKNEGDWIGKLIRSWDATARITLCQGYGVGPSAPLRVLAYAVPVLRLARQLPRHTAIEFYWARRGVLRANPHYDAAEIARVGEATKNLLTAYVGVFYPDLFPRVRILEDIDLGNEAGRAVASLMGEAHAIVRQPSSISSFIESRGGDRALRYMVEHALYMRDPIEFEGGLLPLLVNGMEYPHGAHLVMIGGPSERVFWKLRQQLLERVQTHALWKNHQFFTSVGDPPTYHPQPDEPYADIDKKRYLEHDLSTLLCKAEKVGSGLLRDWLILLQDAAGVERFIIAPNTRGGGAEQEVLQQGFSRLAGWLRSL